MIYKTLLVAIIATLPLQASQPPYYPYTPEDNEIECHPHDIPAPQPQYVRDANEQQEATESQDKTSVAPKAEPTSEQSNK